MTFVKGFIVLLILLISGCVTQPPLVTNAHDQSVPTPIKDKAQIIFINPSNSIAGAWLTEIYDVKGESKELLGLYGSKMKGAQNVDPGKHLFMARTGLSAHFMEANVEAGKRYYVLLRFLYGNGFQLRPIRRTGEATSYSATNPKFETWKTKSKFVEMTANADMWIGKYKKYVDETYAKYWPKWQAKTAEEKAQLTLNKEDAFEITNE